MKNVTNLKILISREKHNGISKESVIIIITMKTNKTQKNQDKERERQKTKTKHKQRKIERMSLYKCGESAF